MVKLNVQKISEKEIVIALLDAGMDTEKINEFIESINSEYFQKSKNILLSQRAELLLKIRDGQEKLYCLDYLTRTAKAVQYSIEPWKGEFAWKYRDSSIRIFTKMFNFVRWQDEEPYSIDNILANCEVMQDEKS